MAEAALKALGPLDRIAAEAPHVPAVDLSLLSGGARFIFRAREAAIGPAGGAFGLALPRTACTLYEGNGRQALWLGPDEWLLKAPGDIAAIETAIEAATAGQPHSLVNVSSRSVGICVKGLKADWALNQFIPRDLSLDAFPVGTCSRTVFAKAEVIIARKGEEEWHIDVWRSFAPYVWGLLEEARMELR